MSAASILAELHAAGATVTVAGDKLRIAPPAAVAPDLLARVRAAKPDLMAMLTGERTREPDADDVPRTDPAGLARCIELDRLIVEYCAARRFTDDVRAAWIAERYKASPNAVATALPIMRAHLAAERERIETLRRMRDAGAVS